MTSVALRPDEGIPGDRFFGFARYNSGFDPSDPQPLPKDRFVVLLKEAELASLQTRFSADSQILEVSHNNEFSGSICGHHKDAWTRPLSCIGNSP
jgi:hypothetical protein